MIEAVLGDSYIAGDLPEQLYSTGMYPVMHQKKLNMCSENPSADTLSNEDMYLRIVMRKHPTKICKSSSGANPNEK